MPKEESVILKKEDIKENSISLINKSREDIIFELLISLNQGNCAYVDERVDYAIKQYDVLLARGIVIADNLKEDLYVER